MSGPDPFGGVDGDLDFWTVSDETVELRVPSEPRPPRRGKYIRTHAEGKWTKNLLALPRY